MVVRKTENGSAQKTGGVAWIGRHRTSFLVYLGLFSLAVFGHHTKWKLGGAPSPIAVVTPQPKLERVPSEAADPTIVKLASPNAARKADFRTVEAIEQLVSNEIRANGVVRYDMTRVAEVASRASGTVWSVKKQVGDGVNKGELLAIIDSVDVGKAKADLLERLVTANLKERVSGRLTNLSANGGLATRHIEEAEASFHEAQIRLLNAQQTLLSLGLKIELEDLKDLSEIEMIRRVQFLGLPAEVSKILDAKTTTANLIPVIAPFDGVVIDCRVTLGETTATGSTQFVVADLSRMAIQLDIRREDAAGIQHGQQFAFSCDGVSDEIRGNVDWISPEVDSKTHTVSVRGFVDNPTVHNGKADQVVRLLRANTFGSGQIVVRTPVLGVTVPCDCLQRDGKQPILFVQVADDLFQVRAIELGSTHAGRVEIVRGVAADERVVQQGSNLLRAELFRRRLMAAQ
jgi:cobalt-zinc-cadmium efflux system membrane fusion protein